MSTPSAAHPRFSHARLLALLALAFVVIAGSAMLRTSTTFDEIVFSTVGARGIRLGDFSFVNDHPRLAQYMFGLRGAKPVAVVADTLYVYDLEALGKL